MRIVTNDKLSDDIQRSLRELIGDSLKSDPLSPKLYWPLLCEKKTYLNYLCFDDEKLIGFLTAFQFSKDNVEISALIHPEYRQQGIFNSLFDSIKPILLSNHIKELTFLYPDGNLSTEACIQKFHAVLLKKEHRLMRHIKDINEDLSPFQVQLQLSTIEDCSLLAYIDAMTFHSAFFGERAQYIENFNDKNRQSFIILFNDRPIGKIHVRIEDKLIIIHDFAILPEFQNQGFGAQTLDMLINVFDEIKFTDFAVDVFEDNVQAMSVYQRAGFQITATYEYWKVSLDQKTALVH